MFLMPSQKAMVQKYMAKKKDNKINIVYITFQGEGVILNNKRIPVSR